MRPCHHAVGRLTEMASSLRNIALINRQRFSFKLAFKSSRMGRDGLGDGSTALILLLGDLEGPEAEL